MAFREGLHSEIIVDSVDTEIVDESQESSSSSRYQPAPNPKACYESQKLDLLECAPVTNEGDEPLWTRKLGCCAICLEGVQVDPRTTMVLVTDAEALLTTRLETGNELGKLPCEHVFHANELQEWFTRKLPYPSCPTCRKPVALGNLEIKIQHLYRTDTRWTRFLLWWNRLVTSLITCEAF